MQQEDLEALEVVLPLTQGTPNAVLSCSSWTSLIPLLFLDLRVDFPNLTPSSDGLAALTFTGEWNIGTSREWFWLNHVCLFQVGKHAQREKVTVSQLPAPPQLL